MAMVGSVDGSTTSSSGTSRQVNNNLGKDDFLKLLITQLKSQDPMNPTQDQEFIAQMAQFSSLEQMKNVADNIKSMKESQDKFMSVLTQTQGTGLIGKEITGILDILDTNGNVVKDAEGQAKTYEIKGVASEFKMIDGKPIVVVNGINVALERVSKITSGPLSDYQSLGQWASMLNKTVTGVVAPLDANGKVGVDSKGAVITEQGVTGQITGYKVVNGQPLFEVTYEGSDGATKKGQLQSVDFLK